VSDDYETRFYVERFGDEDSKYHVVSRDPVPTDDPDVVKLATEKAVEALNELAGSFAVLAESMTLASVSGKEFAAAWREIAHSLPEWEPIPYAEPESLRGFYGALALIVGLLILLLWVAL